MVLPTEVGLNGELVESVKVVLLAVDAPALKLCAPATFGYCTPLIDVTVKFPMVPLPVEHHCVLVGFSVRGPGCGLAQIGMPSRPVTALGHSTDGPMVPIGGLVTVRSTSVGRLHRSISDTTG